MRNAERDDGIANRLAIDLWPLLVRPVALEGLCRHRCDVTAQGGQHGFGAPPINPSETIRVLCRQR
jgi:hypothetical protein